MNIKFEKWLLIIFTFIVVCWFAVDFIMEGSFILFRGGWLSTLFLSLGLIVLVIAWIQYAKLRK